MDVVQSLNTHSFRSYICSTNGLVMNLLRFFISFFFLIQIVVAIVSLTPFKSSIKSDDMIIIILEGVSMFLIRNIYIKKTSSHNKWNAILIIAIIATQMRVFGTCSRRFHFRDAWTILVANLFSFVVCIFFRLFHYLLFTII